MIQKIRNNRSFKLASLTLALNIFAELIIPNQALALTGGPAQPEFNSFTPIGTSDMVDLSSGDMNYNIPLMDVGGYPLNLAYSSGVGMDQEASWVGLGWNLSVGQINRNVRGLPDDFNGDELTYENYLKPNVTVGATFKLEPGVIGYEMEDANGQAIQNVFSGSNQNDDAVDITYGISAVYNNYTGFVMKPSVGVQNDMSSTVSVGFSAESGPDGLSVSPSVSLHSRYKMKENRLYDLGGNVGVSFNSRQGLTSLSFSASKNQIKKVSAKGKREYSSSRGLGSYVGFTDPVYTPTKRVAMETGSFTVNASIGTEIFGVEGEGEITAYGTVMKVKKEEKKKTVKAYGYTRTENADKNAVLDFNREKDGSFSKNSTNLPVTNYTYDIYSVQGQGVGGMYRPFRNQVGYVYDTYVQDGSFSGTVGLEAGTGNLFKVGVDIEATDVTSHSGLWSENNQILTKLEESTNYDPDYERVHFKNVGDLTADQDFGMFSQTGSYQPIHIPFGSIPYYRTLQSKFNKKNSPAGVTQLSVGNHIKRTQRQNRNQAIFNLSKAQVEAGVGYGPLVNESGTYSLPSDAKDHHVAEVQIIRNDGARYVYGLPAYNTLKKEATFAVDTPGDCSTGLVSYSPVELEAPQTLPNDKYFNRVTTPAYVHTHLLTSILSTDYQDLGNDGPTVDDLGSYTKFSYKRMNEKYKWRVPYLEDMASYNEGLRTDDQDDQGNYVYGEKELYYIDQIETKTHVAVFHYSRRKDGKGVNGESGGRDVNQDMYKLDKISLYSIGEYDGLGTDSQSTPIKEVHFEYSYSLCPGVPNNHIEAGHDPYVTGTVDNEISNLGGKLTLKKVYFTYRNSKMGKYTGYRFNYGEYAPVQDAYGQYYNPDEYSAGQPVLVPNSTYNSGHSTPWLTGLNPGYNVKGYDSWGNYKPNSSDCGNLDPLSAPEFPFVEQDTTIQDNRAAVWCMRNISLPSGGDISIEYESDDYAFVQDKEVMRMFKVVGAGITEDASDASDELYSNIQAAELYGNPIVNKAKRYLYVEVDGDAALGNGADYNQYLKGIFGGPPIYFRFLMNTTMVGGVSNGDDPAKFDYISGYLEHEETVNGGKIFLDGSRKIMSIPVKFEEKEGGLINSIPDMTNDVHPVSKATWNFCRKYLNKYSFSNQPNGDTDDIQEIVADLLSPNILSNLIEVFNGPNATLENKNVGRQFVAGKSWLRLNTLHGEKLGGGCRVKNIRMSDVWEEMNPGQGDYQTMSYGQSYSYTLENGKTSGVAAYEPVGNKENPFVQPVYSTTNHLLAPDEENFIEMPFGECFFPTPQVTYSRVTVMNIQAGKTPGAGLQVKKLHRTGKVVTEFYTTKDYPTIVDQTELQAEEDKNPVLANILKLYVRKYLTASQGYVIHLNDMNGKQKSQRVYAEGQEVPISGVDYIYNSVESNPGFTAASDPDQNKGRLDNTVPVINPDGSIEMRTIGVEVDVVNDLRENQTTTGTIGVNTNLATVLFGVVPLPAPFLIPDVSIHKDRFRSVSTTKVINTFGLLKEIIAYDAGAAVYTRNLAWDAMTGEVLVTETVDEYNDKYYSMNYPAHWYYKGMAQASQNLGLQGIIEANGASYEVEGITQLKNYFIEGDELYVPGLENVTPSDPPIAWVKKIIGNQLYLMDKDGNDITGVFGASNNSYFSIVRSGHRNLQSAGIMSVTLMHNPITDLNGNYLLSLNSFYLVSSNWSDWRIIDAGAVNYSQNWEPPCECFYNNTQIYNPYRINKKGVWRTKSSRTYLTGRNKQSDVTPRQQGFFNSFSPMYKLSNNGNWYKDTTNWTFVAQVTKYSPYGFEIENRDALNRYTAAQYGYNNTFPMAVGANTEYREIGFDGFEDYVGFNGCDNAHFNFKSVIDVQTQISSSASHTGKYSLRIGASSSTTLTKKLNCTPAQ